MFYVSKVTPYFFLLALFNLFFSLLFRLSAERELFYLMAVFGFAGFLVVGALYQIVPNSQNGNLPYPKLSWLAFAFALLATFNLYTLDPKGVAVFTFLTFLTAGAHLLSALKNFSPTTVRFLFASLLYLILSGLFLVLYYNAGAPSLQLAVHTFTLGALLNAVYGVEIAWIPMLLMDALKASDAQRLYAAKQLATPLPLLGFLIMDYSLLPFLYLGELAVALYFLYLVGSLALKRKLPAPLPPVVKFFLSGLGLLPLGMLMGAFGASRLSALPYFLELHVDFVFYGFVAFTAFGGIMHLLPRIVWNWKKELPKYASTTVSSFLPEASVREFFRYAVSLYALFIVLESLPAPLSALSSTAYMALLVFFFKALWPTIKALLP